MENYEYDLDDYGFLCDALEGIVAGSNYYDDHEPENKEN